MFEVNFGSVGSVNVVSSDKVVYLMIRLQKWLQIR